MSKTSLVLTVLGPDRPGLVEAVSKLVAEHGGNWVESRMAHLAGQFAGILRVEIDADKADALANALQSLASADLQLVTRSSASPTPPEKLSVVRLELVGHDRPGIVREISRVLADVGVNVEDLSTECTAAPTTGQPLFRAAAMLRLPANVSEEFLRAALEAVAADMMVDIDLVKPA